ncbi:MAG: radical SAM family heme chaperone HemW, partial [Planctomycetota bacterium]
LTLEEGTRFTRRHERGTLVLPPDDDRAEMFEAVDRELAVAGIHRYEISNFARPGHESAHNFSGWRGDDLVGLGASAASHVANRRWTNVADLDEYVRRIRAGEETAGPAEALDEETWAAEDLYLGLRTAEGAAATERLARVPEPGASRLRAALDRSRQAGLLEDSDGRVRLTPAGRLLADTVFDALLAPDV